MSQAARSPKILVRLSILAIALAASSCRAFRHTENHFEAVQALEAGMSERACLAELARESTRLDVVADLPLAADPAVLGDVRLERALADAQAETGRTATHALTVERHYGYLGLARVHLFLDGRDELVGYRLEEVR